MNKFAKAAVSTAVAAGAMVAGQNGSLPQDASSYASYERSSISRNISKTGDASITRGKSGTSSASK